MRHADVLSHVRPHRVTVTVCDAKWSIGLDCAYEWIGAVGFDMDTLAGILPGSIPDSEIPAMYQLVATVPDIDSRWLNASRVALGAGSGRDWWWSLNLIRKSLTSWPYINGKLLLSGINARHMPLPDWLDAAYMLLWGSISDEKERIKLDLELSMPPAGVAVRRSKAQKEKMLADFAAD